MIRHDFVDRSEETVITYVITNSDIICDVSVNLMDADKLPDEFDAIILGTGKLINYNELLC